MNDLDESLLDKTTPKKRHAGVTVALEWIRARDIYEWFFILVGTILVLLFFGGLSLAMMGEHSLTETLVMWLIISFISPLAFKAFDIIDTYSAKGWFWLSIGFFTSLVTLATMGRGFIELLRWIIR